MFKNFIQTKGKQFVESFKAPPKTQLGNPEVRPDQNSAGVVMSIDQKVLPLLKTRHQPHFLSPLTSI